MCRCSEHGAQGQSVSYRMCVRLRASVRRALPPHSDRCAREHSRHQKVRGRPCACRPYPFAAAQRGYRAYRGGRWRRSERFDLRVFPCAHGASRDGLRSARTAGRHDALRHPCLPLPARTLGPGHSRPAGSGHDHGALWRGDRRRAHARYCRVLPRGLRCHWRPGRENLAHGRRRRERRHVGR